MSAQKRVLGAYQEISDREALLPTLWIAVAMPLPPFLTPPVHFVGAGVGSRGNNTGCYSPDGIHSARRINAFCIRRLYVIFLSCSPHLDSPIPYPVKSRGYDYVHCLEAEATAVVRPAY